MKTEFDMPSSFLEEVVNPWLLGADPEFAVLTPPDKVVPNSGALAVNTSKAAGQIGSDHNGRVWELRPAPSPSAYVVTTNLWKLLRQAEMDKLEQFKWKSGGIGGRKGGSNGQPLTLHQLVLQYSSPLYGNLTQAQVQTMAEQQFQAQQAIAAAEANLGFDTLGGHVHFGISAFNAQQRTALNSITTGLLNLDILPHKENSKRLGITQNMSPKYGHMNDPDAVRDCQGHVEYRCAPSWLDKPGQALAALTCYKLAGAKPSTVHWPGEYGLKAGMLDWLETFRNVDVDAWILSQFIRTRGFEAVQADPASDFKPSWRKECPWE